MPWFHIKAKADIKAAAEIYIYGDIGESWYEETTSAADFVQQLNGLKNEAIDIRINSVGGSVPDGLAIYNAIKRHPSQVTIHIDGMAMSIASLIAMSADSIMADNAVLMIHAPWSISMGNSQDMRDMADTLDRWAEAMSSSYASKTGKTKDEVMALLTDGKDHYFTAAQAQAEGFVDMIQEAMPIAASLRVPANSLNRFEGLPQSVNQFIKAAGKAPQQEDSTMNRIEKIRAAFKAHAGKPGVDALLQSCLDDEKCTPEAAGAKLDALLKEQAPPAAANTTAPAPDATAQIEAALKREEDRRNSITASCTPFLASTGVKDLMDASIGDRGVSAEAVNTKLLALLGKEGEPVAGHVVIRENPEREKYRAGIVAAILARSGKADADTRAVAKQSGFHNFHLMEIAKASLSRANIDFSAMNSQQIAQAALTQTTSDFPVLLENAMHKTMLDSYRAAGDTWSRFCRTGSVSDFRAHNRYRTGTIGNYLTVNEAGEYENVAIPDGEKSTITAADRGLIIGVTYQMLINDDIGGFMNLAGDVGRAGRRTIESAVYALLAENSGLGPTMADTNPLFDATHGNVGTGAALSVESIDADRVLMGSQKDISENDFLDLRPAVWLGPLATGGTARVINDAQYDPDTANKLQRPNKVRGLFTDVVDTARLSGTRYYLFADPNDAPVIEVAFLNGESEPMIVMEEQFNSRGTKWRATLDFGVGVVDYRGAVTNAGTA